MPAGKKCGGRMEITGCYLLSSRHAARFSSVSSQSIFGLCWRRRFASLRRSFASWAEKKSGCALPSAVRITSRRARTRGPAAMLRS